MFLKVILWGSIELFVFRIYGEAIHGIMSTSPASSSGLNRFKVKRVDTRVTYTTGGNSEGDESQVIKLV